MNNEAYFRSLTDEINALQNRVRNYIGQHWLSDGEWKESILRAVLRRHLPPTIGIGNGFIVTPKQTSTQIDVLLYDNTKPVVFRDGDFVIVTPDAARGIIEVKTAASMGELTEIFTKLANNMEIIPYGHTDKRFFGVFIYEGKFGKLNEKSVAADALDSLFVAARENTHRTINCVSIGDSFFLRYWMQDPTRPTKSYETWHAYNLKHKAPAYFIHNVIGHLCPDSMLENEEVCYPTEGKESSLIAARSRKTP